MNSNQSSSPQSKKSDIPSDIRFTIPNTNRANIYTIPNSEINRKASTFDDSDCFLCMCLGCSVIALVGLGITNAVFCIMALVRSNDHVKVICPQSNLWAFVLVSLILSYTANSTASKTAKEEKICFKLFGFILNILINSGLIGWGWYELIGNGCGNVLYHNENTTLLYVMAEIQLIVGSIVVGLVFIILISLLVKSFCK